jgi:catechol 2,3-dioxygenase-like lactoylglutathione lyase family enzyme
VAHSLVLEAIMASFTIAIDHVVLTVRAIEPTVAFYVDALGVDAVTFGEGRRPLGRLSLESGHVDPALL